MATLSRELRKSLEKVVVVARGEAEAGARKALDQLAVARHEPWPTMTTDQQRLRRRLRAHGRQLGDRLEDRGRQGIEHLVTECAYEHWHRMLFARFLADCGLLIEPASGVPVSVDECKELSREHGVDWISVASAFAQGMLPQIFRADDAVLEIALPAEHRQPLEQLLTSLPTEVFLADDSLGWVYQFWQSAEKQRINESETKIGSDQLPAVTQLFTEDYMVNFLLHNTLGAWWAGKVLRARPDLARTAASEDELREACALPGIGWAYLRFTKTDDVWRPVAGSFDGWPKAAKDITLLDPCMGSGHFMVSALVLLAAMRAAEEQLPLPNSLDAVLRDNLFGLEIDPRCTQIAAFNLALAGWRIGGYRPVPKLHLACSGLSVGAKQSEWLTLAEGDARLEAGMKRLYDLFYEAPTLGSLIDPRSLGADVLEAGFRDLAPVFEKAIARERRDEAAEEIAVTANGLAQAAEILSRQFTLVTTNVPYLGRGKQDDTLMCFCETHHPHAKADLATCFLERCLTLCQPRGSAALVITQNWLSLKTYKALRQDLLRRVEWNSAIRLGPGAFETISGEVVNVALLILTNEPPARTNAFAGLDVSSVSTPVEKAIALRHATVAEPEQASQLANPDSVLVLGASSGMTRATLAHVATSSHGLGTFDSERFTQWFWEQEVIHGGWIVEQSAPTGNGYYSGCNLVLRWEDGRGALAELMRLKESDGYSSGKWKAGTSIWGQKGVLVSLMKRTACSFYLGAAFDPNAGAIVPTDPHDLLAIAEFCFSGALDAEVTRLHNTLYVPPHTLIKVPFDRELWTVRARERFSNSVPPPISDDLAQWLFDGHPRSSLAPLHTAVARLLGYRWPRQTGASLLDCPAIDPDTLERHAAVDGIVCLTQLRGEGSAADRLQTLLADAYGSDWSVQRLNALLRDVGFTGKSLEDWLREGFCEQHCELFHQRPFVWHVWDGRKDGFSALVNYHKLTRANLEKLTYAYLGDWIRRQEASVEAGEAGSDARLVAAKQLQDELKKILEGEPPYDIFVRWKPIAQQAIGWEPDLNDGVGLNIRPFLVASDVGKRGAGILRARPNVKWDKDRGKEPSRPKDEFPWFWGWDGKTKDFAGGLTFDGNRWNDLHYSREFKMAARRQKGLA